MTRISVAIIGAGPYGLSVAAHLAAYGIQHRIFGEPMSFWSTVAKAGAERYLKSYCFGTNLSTPKSGFTFAEYSAPRGLETFEPCAISDFAEYGKWFSQNMVPWVERREATRLSRTGDLFEIVLDDQDRCLAPHVVVASGLTSYAHIPAPLDKLPKEACTHTFSVRDFSAFKGLRVAVTGAGQSALEAAALLHEAGAEPCLLIRDRAISWQTRVVPQRSILRRMRSPISGLGTGPKAWILTRYPGALYHTPDYLRTRFVRTHLPAEGAWWLRPRVDGIVQTKLNTTVVDAKHDSQGVELQLNRGRENVAQTLRVDRVISGTGYVVDIDRLKFIDPSLRDDISCLGRAPRLSAHFESSVPGLRFVGPASAMSFGPLFRFVVGAEYTAQTISAHIAASAHA